MKIYTKTKIFYNHALQQHEKKKSELFMSCHGDLGMTSFLKIVEWFN